MIHVPIGSMDGIMFTFIWFIFFMVNAGRYAYMDPMGYMYCTYK